MENARRATPWQKILVLLPLGLLLLSTCASANDSASGLSNWLTIETIQQRVTTALPVGTPLAEVESYFEKNKVEHSFYKPENRMYAMLHNIWGGGWLTDKDAQIIIHFGADDKVDAVEVRAIYTSL
jgi:hypothetical protein